MKELSKIDVYYCKLQGVILRLNLLRKFRLLTWKQVLELFVDFIEKDKWFSQDVDFVHRWRITLNNEKLFEVDNPSGSLFSESLRYLSSRKLFHDFDDAFLFQKVDDLSLLANFLEDYCAHDKKSSFKDKIKI